MKNNTSTPVLTPVSSPLISVGIDVADQYSSVCMIDAHGEILERSRIRTTPEGLARKFAVQERWRVSLEVGAHSPWISKTLTDYGHEVIVANTRRLQAIRANTSKSDDQDAETLARIGRVDPKLLFPIRHRGPEAQAHLAVLRARDTLVRSRTVLINHVRGAVKSSGGKIKKYSSESFARKAADSIPEALKPAIHPLLKQIQALTQEIARYDAQIECIARNAHPETDLLRQIRGVGALTAVAYVLVIEDPGRFENSRMVGAYLGLRPRRAQTGNTEPQLRITKTGDRMLRRLLVGSAHYIMGPFGEDCDLRRWGMKLSERGGKSAKKRAIVAVARKLAVLLHHLWTTAVVYEPLCEASRRQASPAVARHETLKPGQKRAASTASAASVA